ncbi:hypothetical protein PSPO01_04902 [Paraphaeosphaeria sporulosa]
MQQELFTEKVVLLEKRMKATFVQLAGQKYLQEIGKEVSNPEALEFTIPGDQTKQLALLVDDIGIRNIAFTADAKGRPAWIRPDNRKHKIVLDPREFTAIRIVSDGHNIGYPRPILPCMLGSWAPLPAAAVDESFLALPGYIEASYVDFNSLDEVHLLFDQSQVLIGVLTKGEKGCVTVSLQGNDGAAVRLFRNWDGRSTLQV